MGVPVHTLSQCHTNPKPITQKSSLLLETAVFSKKSLKYLKGWNSVYVSSSTQKAKSFAGTSIEEKIQKSAWTSNDNGLKHILFLYQPETYFRLYKGFPQLKPALILAPHSSAERCKAHATSQPCWVGDKGFQSFSCAKFFSGTFCIFVFCISLLFQWSQVRQVSVPGWLWK